MAAMSRFRKTVRRIVGAPGKLLGLRQENRNLRSAAKDSKERMSNLERRIAAQEREIGRLRAVIRKLESADAVRTLPEPLAQCVTSVLDEGLTLLPAGALIGLVQALIDVQLAGVHGMVIEAGTARGGSAIALATAKSPDRAMKVYDVFGMIPPPSDKDGEDVHKRYDVIKSGKAKGGGEYYGYRDHLYEEVTASFAAHGVPVDQTGVELIRGLFQDTIELDQPVALAHVDGDWYESTMTCLERIVPWLSVGGRLVIDDYFKWSGCRTAVDEFFAGKDEFELVPGLRLQVIRTAESPALIG